MRLPNVKILLCWPSRMQIYGFVQNRTFLEQFVRMGVPGHFPIWGYQDIFQSGGTRTFFPIWGYQDIFSIWGYQDIFPIWGYQDIFSVWGYQDIFSNLGVPGHFFQSGGTRTFFPIWGTSTIFSTLHGSLWLGKDKGSIMKSAESGGTIHLEINFSSKVYSESLLKVGLL